MAAPTYRPAYGAKTVTDADPPDTDQVIPPHFGYELYCDGTRVGGPGHVYFRKNRTQFSRDSEKMHERPLSFWQKTPLRQERFEDKGTRLDSAVRPWAAGADDQVKYMTTDDEAYQREIWSPPSWWNEVKVPCPSFGRRCCSLTAPRSCQTSSETPHVWESGRTDY